MEWGLSRVKIHGFSRHAMGQICQVWRLQQSCLQKWGVCSLDLIGILFHNNLHFKKVEELFRKVLLVDQRLKREISLERGCCFRYFLYFGLARICAESIVCDILTSKALSIVKLLAHILFFLTIFMSHKYFRNNKTCNEENIWLFRQFFYLAMLVL